MKHVLSKESQELFNKLSGALTDEANIEWRTAALAAIATEPGIHQLTTYLLSFIAEKVTHNLKNLFVLEQMMKATKALLDNQAIYLDPYIAYMVPPVLTCCIGNKLGPTTRQAPSNASSETLNGNSVNGHATSAPDHFALRDHAASLLNRICKKHSSTNQGLRSRITRTCLKQFLDPHKSPGTHYGAVQAIILILGPVDAMKMIVLPNLSLYNTFLKEALADESKRVDAEKMAELLMASFTALAMADRPKTAAPFNDLEDVRGQLNEKIGDYLADRIIAQGKVVEAQVILQKEFEI